MALTPGTRLGPYEVTAQIGVGGMGEVYKATDTNLKRAVAIKVLPASVAADAERLARFQREAEVLAALNHPNIAAIYGLERSAAATALVMELVEGPTLADCIAQGVIPVDEALPIAKQIAEALEAAHEQGIIHRDLKPTNINVRSDGTVKVLDFGLAKAMEPTGAMSPNASMSPTITSPAMMTGVGMILGTDAYMSPEQARGKTVDKRSDIWAFGCVLFEMLTGRRAFGGDDVQDTFVAIMRDEPDWARLPATLSPALGTYIRRCLHKDPRQRIHDIADMRLALEGAFEMATPQTVPSPSTPRRAGWRSVTALTGGALMVAVVAGAAVWYAVRAEPSRVIRTSISTVGAAAPNINVAGTARDLAVTPDGSRVVYRGTDRILVRALDQLDPTPLGGVGSPQGLFVSPDGDWIGFFDGFDALKKVAITGGPPVTVAALDGSGVRGATWGEDGTIVFATTSAGTGLQRVSAAGGDLTVLTKPNVEGNERDHIWPEFLPGGQAVLFTIELPGSSSVDNFQVAVLDLRNGTQRVLIRGGSHAHYVRSGHLVYAAAGTLRAVPFDLSHLAVTGPAIPVVPQLVTTVSGVANFDVAANGTLVYMPGSLVNFQARRTLVWVDRQGREAPLRVPERAYVYPRLSPDGSRIAVSIRDQQDDIWVWDVGRETLTRMTFGPGVEQYPAWTPDGRRLLFGRAGTNDSTQTELFWEAADGTGPAEALSKSEDGTAQIPYAVSPDGSRVVLREGVGSYDVAVLQLGNNRRTDRLLRSPFTELNAEISPNGRWLAYESNESGQREVYVRPFPNVDGGRWQVSTGGGTRPLWAKRGQELFYLATADAEATLMSVRVESGATWSAGIPTKLFSGRFFRTPAGPGEGRTYDVSPDGQRFLMIKDRSDTDQNTAPTSLIVVQHFDEELKRLVPTK